MTPRIYSQQYTKLSNLAPPAKVYLYGDAQLLKEGFMRGVRTAVEGYEDFNLDVFWMNELKGSNVHKRIFDSLLMLPMLGDRRVVILRNYTFSHALEKSVINGLKSFQFPETAILAIEADKLDLRTEIGKYVKKEFDVFKLDTPSDKAMQKWVEYFASKMDKKITIGAAQELVKLSGISLSAIREEIRKLANYIEADTISATDIRDSASHSRATHVFQFANAFGALDFKFATKLALELLDFGEGYSTIFFWMRLGLSDLLWARLDPEGLGERLGRRKFLAGKLIPKARKLSTHAILSSIENLHKLDILVKSSAADDRTVVIWALGNVQNELLDA